jgi:cardiolipin synthase
MIREGRFLIHFFHRILSHVTLTVLLVLLQIGGTFFLLYGLSALYAPIAIAFTVFSLFVSIRIINKPGNPSVKMAWLVFVMLFPMVGWLIYLLTGGKQPTRRMRRRLAKSRRIITPAIPEDGAIRAEIEGDDRRAAGLAGYLSANGFPVYRDTDALYYPTGERAWEAILDALSAAEHFIFLEYFIISEGEMWDRVLEILTRKARAGLDVRVMYDGVGSITTLPRKYRRMLAERGIKAAAFNQVRPIFSALLNHRDHRKILVIDGHTAFTGGINLADEYINRRSRCGYWKDNAVMLCGMGVRTLTLLFLEMWNSVRPTDRDAAPYLPKAHLPESPRGEGFVQPYGASPLDGELLAQNVYFDIISRAEKYVWFSTPYLVIDHAMTTALTYAAKRGVDVRIVTPGIPDKRAVYAVTRSYYGELLRGGVKIYEYAPGFVHSKCCVSDDVTATVGTVNLDYRSFNLHFENGCLLYRAPAVDAVKSDLLGMIAESREIKRPYRGGGLLRQLGSALLRLIAPLL